MRGDTETGASPTRWTVSKGGSTVASKWRSGHGVPNDQCISDSERRLTATLLGSFIETYPANVKLTIITIRRASVGTCVGESRHEGPHSELLKTGETTTIKESMRDPRGGR